MCFLHSSRDMRWICCRSPGGLKVLPLSGRTSLGARGVEEVVGCGGTKSRLLGVSILSNEKIARHAPVKCPKRAAMWYS